MSLSIFFTYSFPGPKVTDPAGDRARGQLLYSLGQVQGAQVPVTICLRVWGTFSNFSEVCSHYNMLLFKNNFQCLHFHYQTSLPRLSALTSHSPLTVYFCCTGPAFLYLLSTRWISWLPRYCPSSLEGPSYFLHKPHPQEAFLGF